MSHICKITYYWLFIAVGYIFHSLYHLSGGVFGESITMEGATGHMPYWMHFFRLILEIGSLTFALLTTQLATRTFRLVSFGWAIVLGLANALHLLEELIHSPDNLSQVGVLSWILIVNIFLISTTRQWFKEANRS